MNIPITISLRGNSAELDRDLFGLGEKVTDPKILKFMKTDNPRYINKDTEIVEGVTLAHAPNQTYRAEESLETGFVDYFYLISIGTTGIGLGELSYKITDWLLKQTMKQDCKIVLEGKEMKSKEELQSTLDKYFQETNNRQ